MAMMLSSALQERKEKRFNSLILHRNVLMMPWMMVIHANYATKLTQFALAKKEINNNFYLHMIII